MALFIISRLLLMALFLRPSTGNEELKKHTTLKPDHSERYQEFCLRMPDDSHWTSSKPVTQPPTSSSQAPKTSEQPTQPNRKSTSQPNTDAVSSSSLMHQTPAYLSTVQHPKSTTPNNQEEVTTEKIRVGMRPLEMVSNPCQCGETEIDPGPEVSELKNLLIHNPTATCRHREFTTRMTDGRKFCVPRETALSYINKELQSLVSSSAGNNGLRDTHPRPENKGCITCFGAVKLGNFDLKDVKSVWMQHSLGCPSVVHVTMWSKGGICVDSSKSEFRILLKKLEI